MTFIDNSRSPLKKYLPELIALRRHLHSYPELSGEENQTSILVAGELRKYGWSVREGVGRTGLLAEFGHGDGPLVGLRVDMDALPVEEFTQLDYSSRRQGIMHACGHDFHTCIGLGVARVLSEQKDLSSKIRLLFQPAEEIAKGARWMKEDGALQGLEAIFGVHLFPELPVGSIGVRAGSLTAEAGELEIEILGKGGHGARPHESIDAIWIASKVVSGLQESISRRLNALDPVVISFGKIEGGKAFNVIADRVRLLGTVRYLNQSSHERLPSWIEDIVQSIVCGLGGKAVVKYRCIAPIVNNDPDLTDLVERSAVALLGKEKVLRLEKPSLGAEDFSEFLRDVPGTMFRLGVAGRKGCAPLHSGYFAPDEGCLEIGIEVIVKSLLTWVKEQAISSSRLKS